MKNIVNNTIMLMIFNIAKIVFPFITLPYLTRILTTDSYGTVAYVKTVMSYMQIFVDFGFVLSATKDIVKNKENKNKLEFVIGDTMIARIILGLIGFFVVLILSLALPILKENLLFTMLSYVVVFESIFLMDFLFRGLEKMHVITIRFIVMKLISTALTFVLIKNDSNLLLIPILDILSSSIAILLVFFEIKKLKLKMHFSGIKNAITSIKKSFIYFISNVASTSFNALSTIIIGIYVSPTDVAYWSVCMQIIGSIQACYSPISDGIYPEMIRSKNISIIKKVLKIFLPIIGLGCIATYFLAKPVLLVLGGEKYLPAVPVLQLLIPNLFVGFLSIIFGWPTLGAIGKEKETTISTVSSIALNIVLLVILIITNTFNLYTIAIVRIITECMLFGIRYLYYRKNKELFSY
ncbi:MAG TPA: oligosaccharide flippase family protein [Clostridiaceae bacterium]|nr:oligosaccharide flippase family protein [Clostridiaceae bacterium]